MDRRTFVSALTVSGALLKKSISRSGEFRVGVIGHTGRGDFGHGIDAVWKNLYNTKIVGIADGNAQGLSKVVKRLDLPDSVGYIDYRKMLSELRPDIVAVCPRHVDQHAEMTLAAINSGAKGIYIEKPFLRTPGECDAVLAASQKANTKIAIAHRNRYHPALARIKNLIAEGAIGRILEIRGRGKGDRRGGLEDLWVLGSHVLNLITYFSGPPASCSGQILQDGRLVTRNDLMPGAEGLGMMAGNELHARFLMESGVIAYFDSIANDGTQNLGFGLQITGSEGMVHLFCDKDPLAYYRKGNPFDTAIQGKWLPVTSAGIDQTEPIDGIHRKVYDHILPAKDLLLAVGGNTSPICNAREGALTIEMISAIMLSHIDQAEVTFPLKERRSPFEHWE